MSRAQIPYAIAAACGVAIWFGICLVTGRREAWDAELYWTIGYPLGLVACAGLAWFFPKRQWRWALTVFLAQGVAMALRNAEIGSLAPIGLILFGALSLPGMLAGKAAAFVRRQLDASGQG